LSVLDQPVDEYRKTGGISAGFITG